MKKYIYIIWEFGQSYHFFFSRHFIMTIIYIFDFTKKKCESGLKQKLK